jgi:hypothetical protein
MQNLLHSRRSPVWLSQREKVRRESRAVLLSVRDFIEGFNQRMKNAPAHEKKELIRRCVSRLIVDPGIKQV